MGLNEKKNFEPKTKCQWFKLNFTAAIYNKYLQHEARSIFSVSQQILIQPLYWLIVQVISKGSKLEQRSKLNATPNRWRHKTIRNFMYKYQISIFRKQGYMESEWVLHSNKNTEDFCCCILQKFYVLCWPGTTN